MLEMLPAPGSGHFAAHAHGNFESEHLGYCGAQDTFYLGHHALTSKSRSSRNVADVSRDQYGRVYQYWPVRISACRTDLALGSR